METSPNDQLDAVRKALGEPFGAEFRDKVWKIRTNLLAVSLISLFVAFAKLSVAPGSTVFGLQLSGLTDKVVENGLLLITRPCRR